MNSLSLRFPMRSLLLLVALPLAGCADPASCEALDARQSADALRTCVASASLADEPAVVTLADGTPLTADRLPPPSTYTFDDGERLSEHQGTLEWKQGDTVVQRDSIGPTAGLVRVASGDRYAIPLADGRLLLRSRDGSDPVDLPVEVAWMEIGDWRGAYGIWTAFSADGARVAVSDARGTRTVADARTGERLLQAAPDTTDGAVALSADGAYLAAVLADREVGVWEVGAGTEVGRWAHPRRVQDVSFGSDGSLLVWLAERTSTTRSQMSNTTRSRTTVEATQSYETTSTTPPALIVWRLP